ncbi:hypothetical protein MATL_G00073930 [Megalops atlanticus]|uniref:Uncharacterized protein n=1 Tax=Megalops atlanticus TaxID=7932 RepID=A0A9D3T951_MEGAT|nr:hypothetical protein MATL_G00073930 [Megalops atlanticus]
MDAWKAAMLDIYFHYKFYHFFSLCFALGCGLASYRPYYSLVMPSVLSVFSGLAFEFVGISFGLPAHTKQCKGQPYHRRDAYWGFGVAFFVAVLNLHSPNVYTMSYGFGIMAFAVRGAVRKYKALWKIRRSLYYERSKASQH